MKLQRATLLAILTRFFTLVNIFGMLLLQLHFLGLEGQGKMAWVSSTIVLFTQYSQWVGGGALAFLSTREKTKNLFFSTLIWIAIGEFVFLSVIPFILDKPFTLIEWLMILLLCSFQALFTVFQNILLGKNQTIQYHISICIQTISTFLLTWFALYFNPCIQSVLGAMILSFLLTVVYSGWATRKDWKSFETSHWKEKLVQLLQHGKYVQGANTLLLILVRMPIYVFPFISSGQFKDAGIYAMLLYLSEGILLFTKSFSVLQFAKICNTTDHKTAWQITLAYIKKSIVVSSLFSLLWIVFPMYLIEPYIPAPLTMIQKISYFLIPGIFLQSISIIVLHLFSGTGNFKFNFHNAIITFLSGSICYIAMIKTNQSPLMASVVSLCLAWTAQWITYMLLIHRWKKLEKIQ